MSSILLLEDDASLGATLVDRLSKEGYGVKWFQSCQDALAILNNEKPSLAVVDVGLPDRSGFEFVRELRELYDTPVVCLTAMNSADYRLKGFELGVDDYVPKPFHLRELLLRIKRILDSRKLGNQLHGRSFLLDCNLRQIQLANGDSIKPIGKDFDVLLYLFKNQHRIVPRSEIYAALWPAKDSDKNSLRTIDNSILRLRGALGELGAQIHSERGVGYRWVE